jgi:hypothetical protein
VEVILYTGAAMSLQGPIPVEFGTVFPTGAYAAGAFDPVRNFDASTGEKFVQSTDKATGAPLWVIEVIPVEFTGMTVTPYVNQAGRLAYSLKATGIRAPGRGRPGPETREVAA